MPFQKGHKLAKGGARAGAGRKPDTVRLELDALMKECVTLPDRQAMLKAAVAQAKNGSPKHLEFIFDRLYGKPAQRLEHGGEGGDPITIRVEYADPDPDAAEAPPGAAPDLE